MRGFLDRILRRPSEPVKSPRNTKSVPGNEAYPLDPSNIVVLVPDIAGSGDVSIADQIRDGFSDFLGITVVRRNKGPRRDSRRDLIEQLADTGEQAFRMLRDSKADVLAWGTVADDSRTIVFRFIAAAADTENRPGTFGLGDSLIVGLPLVTPALDLIVGASIAAAFPAKDGAWEVLRRVLTVVVNRLETSADQALSGLTPVQAATARSAHAGLVATLWRASGDAGYLEAAASLYRKALEGWAETDEPLVAAMVQTHLAAVQEVIGDRDDSAQALADAANAYWAVSRVLKRDSHPIDWALAHVRRGLVLYRLAILRGSQVPQLQEAALALDTALEVLSGASTPEHWADVMNQLGVVLMAIGSQSAGLRALERSAVAFRRALEVRRRDVRPLGWAQTVNNLGAVSFAIGKRSRSESALREAEACFEGARKVYSQNGQRQTVVVIDKNLDRVRDFLKTLP